MSKKILVAEDDRSILEVVKIILEQENYQTFFADKEEGIYKNIKENKPDLILLDIWLGGSNGGKIAKTIKSNKETKHIPVIMISANNETEKITKESGANDFLLKPFNIDDLLQKVKKHIQKP